MKILMVLVALTASCSSIVFQGNKVSPVSTRKDFQLDIPKGVWEPIFFEAIDERAGLSGLKTLRSGSLPDDDLEVRVWHGFGLTALDSTPCPH